MLVNHIFRTLLSASLFASPAISCGPHAADAPNLDVRSLIMANNLARRNCTMPTKKIALDNVRVFNGHRVLPPSTVVIDGPIIGCACDTANAEHIDAKGGVLLPGLIDAHTHPSNITDMQNLARWGITSTYVMACYEPALCTSLQNHPGLPSILRSTAPAASPDSVHGNITTRVDASLLLNSTSEVTPWVQRQLAANADYFKFIAESPGFDQETLDMLVKEAHQHGKPSVIHAAIKEAYIQAIHSKTNHIHHAPLDAVLPSKMACKMLQNGQISTPTLTMMRATALVPSHSSANNFTAALATMSLLYEAGVTILAGTDANMQPGVPAHVAFGTSLHDELENLIEAGMSNVEALRAGTVNAARAFGLQDRGVIQAGMRADLVLIGGDPLEDIKNTRDIRSVWIGGVEVPIQA